MSFAACGGGDDPGPSKKDEVTEILTSGTWKVQSVTVDGTDQTDVYKDMTLKFTSLTYNTTDGIPVWPAVGTWTFTDDNATAFQRDDGVVVDILSATGTSLKLGLVWDETTLGSGRSASVAGDHVFSFVK
jgi:hypothetical protein